jgi:hypothetical protein
MRRIAVIQRSQRAGAEAQRAERIRQRVWQEFRSIARLLDCAVGR